MTQHQDADPATGPAAPMSWEYAQSVTRTEEASVSKAVVLRALGVTIVAFLVAGVLAAFVWAWLADPAEFLVTSETAFMDEAAAADQFGVEVVYALIAVVASAALSLGLTLRYSHLGWSIAVGLAAAATIAAVVQWQLGIVLGPPQPASVLDQASPGDQVPSRLGLESHGILLLWPITALVLLIGHVGVRRNRPGESRKA